MYNVFLTKSDENLKIKCTKLSKLNDYLVFQARKASHTLNLREFIEGENNSCIIWNEKELYIGAYYTNPFAIYNYRDIINSLEELDIEKSEYIKNLRNTLKNNTAESILDDENIDLYMLKSLYEIFSMPQIKKNNPRAQVLFYEI
ncbi:MAG: hypothetical protein JW924_14190 [Fusobacteriaceae bacterium]|nr:hypothetical protein [Fusobacteriaceae bacterium]